LEFFMLNHVRLGFVVAMAISLMLALMSCGGVGSAPINGVGSLGQVGVSVSPQSMTIATGTTQPFTATVVNTGVTGVGWLVNGFPGGINPTDGSSSFGTIDKNGNYTAPPFIPEPPTLTVTAVAMADNSATANASVSIDGTPSPVSISPLSANLEVGGIALFTATVKNADPSVTWLVENVPNGNTVVGTILPVPGTQGEVTYVAPLVVPGGNPTAQVHVTAESVAIPQEAASAVVNLSQVGSIVVAITEPVLPPTVQAGQTQSFQASVKGASDTTVSWEVDAIAGGNANVGTIETGAKGTAVYTAPLNIPDPPQVIVTAVSNAQPLAQASVLVNLIPAQKAIVAITPDPCTNTDAVPVATQVNFSASVSGPANQSVTWQVNQIPGGNASIGTITQTGSQTAVYTAPANVPNPATVVVAAVSVASPLASATQPLTISTTAVTRVVISPTSATVNASGAGQDFTAKVQGMGDADIAVTWNVNGEAGGDPTIGTIEQEAPQGCVTVSSYDPPATVPNPDQVSVTAVTANNVSSPAAVVTIVPPPEISFDLTPGPGDAQTVQVQTANNKVQYQAYQYKLENGQQVVDTTDPVNWTLTSTGQNCSVNAGSICGTLTPTGINTSQQFTATYTAPNTVPPNPQVVVTITSVVDSSASSYNDVTITNAPPTISINGPTSIQAGTTTPSSFTAIITNANPNSLSWELGCISDWDGVSLDGNCYATSQDDDKDGPGCITYQGLRRPPPCETTSLTINPAIPLLYTPPKTASTAAYVGNVCTPNGDPKASIVPITVTMDATGCPAGGCQAVACVTVTP
jgi:hypothetical protein